MKALLSVHWNQVLGKYCLGSAVDGADEIAAWLSDDLPAGARSIEHWIEKFESIERGEKSSAYLGSGNAHHVRAAGENVFLECQFDEDMKVFLTRTQILDALKNYSTFIDVDLSHEEAVPAAFEVEYEAVGEAARDRYLALGGKLGWNQT